MEAVESMARGQVRPWRTRVAGALRSLVALIVLLCTACALGVTPQAQAADHHVYRASFGPDSTEGTDFARATEMAVDQATGDIYVIDQAAGALYKFDAVGLPLSFGGSSSYISGNAITGLSFFSGLGEVQVAVDPQSHHVYVTSGNAIQAFEANGEPAEFTAGPGAGTNEIGSFTELIGVAVDVNGDIYASDYGPGGNGVISIYAPTGEFITSFETATPANLAVDSQGAVYVQRYQGTVLKFTPSQFPVESGTQYIPASEPVDPDASITVSVDPATNDVYIVERIFTEYRLSQYDVSGNLITVFAGAGEEGELALSGGVAVNGQSEYVYVSNFDLSGHSKVEIFAPPLQAAPTISSTGGRNVTGDSATLVAEVNPNTFATSYYFELGISDCSATPDPCTMVQGSTGNLMAGFNPVEVSHHVNGLVPGTTYHFRVVATNSLGTTFGPDKTFATHAVGGTWSLADGRAWEQVSPATKEGGGVIKPPRLGPTQASATGASFGFQTIGSLEPSPEGNRAPEAAQALARHAAGGWESQMMTPPYEFATPAGLGGAFRLFSSDLARVAAEPQGSGPLSVEASEATPYLRENFVIPPRWRPIVTGKAGYANVPPGTKFGPESTTTALAPVQFRGASSDLRHVIISSQVALSPDAAAATTEGRAVLYHWYEGALDLVSVLPNGEAAPGVLGSGPSKGSVTHAISDDGRYVYWSDIERTSLFLRDRAAGKTVRVDVVQPDGTGAGPQKPIFQAASADGSRAFFTDSQHLTAAAGEEGYDLYECEVVQGPTGAECVIRNLTSTSGGGESAEVQGMVTVDEGGDTLYVVANGTLGSGASPGTCGDNPGTKPPGATCNLISLQRTGSSWSRSFISKVGTRDAADWGMSAIGDQTEASTGKMVAAASPSGRFYVFMSSLPLTGFDSRDATSGQATEEVFLYDRDSGTLRCVSCNPTGGRPNGLLRGEEAVTPAIDWAGIWENRWVSATLPEGNVNGAKQGPVSYRPRVVLDNGRVFFNGLDSLVPGDANSVADAYQYEPVGVGSCGSATMDAGTVASAGGCVSLLSSGTSGRETAILDASKSGNDVFILTGAQLSPTDVDSGLDVYDAHVCGSGWACPERASAAAPACASAETCHGDSSQPVSGAIPGSAITGAGGNLKVKRHHKCRRHKKRCQRHKHRHHKRLHGHHKRGGGR